MTTTTLTLTDFLLARIAEDEAVTQAAADFPHSIRSTPGGTTFDIVADSQDGRADHWLAVDPARVLAECEATRRIVEEHRLITDPERLVKVWRDPTPGVACERCAGDPLGDRPLEDIGPCDTLLFLAAVYSDHEDYREEWRP